MAAVVCVLTAAGPFLEMAIAAGAGVFEKGLVLHLCFCLRARTALRAGTERSMVEGSILVTRGRESWADEGRDGCLWGPWG